MDASPALPSPPVVGVFDSGVGGLSVLRALHAALPHAALRYVADSGHAPYGERDPAHVVERSQRIAAHLVGAGAALVVVACNTATAIAIDALRARWPAPPFVGVEPGLKPARAATRNGRIGVLATPATLASERWARLVARHADGATVVAQPCPGLAAEIERGESGPALRRLVDDCCAPLVAAGVDTVVLGCTHYPFARDAIAAALGPGVALVDTAEAIARQAARLLPPHAALAPPPPRLETTGDAARLARIAATWLDFPVEVATLSL